MGRGAVGGRQRWLVDPGEELMRNMPNACPQLAMVLAGGKHVLLPWLVLQSCCWQDFLSMDGVY